MKITPLMWRNFKKSLACNHENEEDYEFNEEQISDGSIRNMIIHLFEEKLMKEMDKELHGYKSDL